MNEAWFKVMIGVFVIISVVSIVWTINFSSDCSARGGETLRNIWNWPVCVGAER